MTQALATTYTRPENVTPEVWDALNALQKKNAIDTNRANAFLPDFHQWLAEIAAIPTAERKEKVLLKLQALNDQKDKRRFFHSFLTGGLIAATNTNGKKFQEALDPFLALHLKTDANGNGFFDNVQESDEEEFIFEPLELPTPTEKTVKANELTSFLKDAKIAAVEYSEAIKGLTELEIADLTSLTMGILNFIFTQLNLMFPDNPLPKTAAEFIRVLIQVKPPETYTFQMTDAQIMALSGIKSKTTILGMRNALIQWQAEVNPKIEGEGGIGLIEMQKHKGSPNAEVKGTIYTLHILNLLASKALMFVSKGISVSTAQLAVTAIATDNEEQKKLIPAELMETAENLIQETTLEAASLPPVGTEDSAAAAARKTQAQVAAQTKATEVQKQATAKQDALADHVENLAKYYQLQSTPEQITPDIWNSYVQARLAEIRFDKTNLLDVESAKGQFETTYKQIENLMLFGFALLEKMPAADAKAQKTALLALAKNIASVPVA